MEILYIYTLFCHEVCKMFSLIPMHTAGSDTIFVQIYMDPPPEVPGRQDPLNMPFEV